LDGDSWSSPSDFDNLVFLGGRKGEIRDCSSNFVMTGLQISDCSPSSSSSRGFVIQNECVPSDFSSSNLTLESPCPTASVVSTRSTVNSEYLANMTLAQCPKGYAMTGIGIKSCHDHGDQLVFVFRCVKLEFEQGVSEIIRSDCPLGSSSSQEMALSSLLSSTVKTVCPRYYLVTSFKFTSCSNHLSAFELTCTNFATREQNGCVSSPCHNGGTCIDDITKYSCICASNFSGPTCDHGVSAGEDAILLSIVMTVSSTGTDVSADKPWVLYIVVGLALIGIVAGVIWWLYWRSRNDRQQDDEGRGGRPPIESEHLIIRDYEQSDSSDL